MDRAIWRSRASGRPLTIGNFDGVHVGHQKILTRSDRARASTDRMSAVLTFYPHPARVLRPEAAPALLETLQQRLARFEAMGMDAALVLSSTKSWRRPARRNLRGDFWWRRCGRARCW